MESKINKTVKKVTVEKKVNESFTVTLTPVEVVCLVAMMGRISHAAMVDEVAELTTHCEFKNSKLVKEVKNMDMMAPRVSHDLYYACKNFIDTTKE